MTIGLQERNATVAMIIALGETPWGMRKDRSKVVSTAWMLVSCEYNFDCDESSSMETFCSMMAAECTKYWNAREYIRAMVASDAEFSEAEDRATELITSIDNGDWDALGLDLVW